MTKLVKNERPLIFGEVLFDQFPDDSVVLGGAPFNVAWHLQAFGLMPLFISRVGNDALGRQIQGAMTAWGMDCAGLQLDSSHPTGTVKVSIEEGEPRFDIVPERAYDYIDASSLPPLKASMIYHGSLALRNAESRDALDEIKRLLQVPRFVDVNLRAPWWDPESLSSIIKGARWIKLNEDELAQLVSENLDLESRAEKFQSDNGVDELFITRGPAGAVARTADGTKHEVTPVADIKIVDTVGAGDAFASVLILGLSHGWSLPQTLERAQTFASAVVGVRGATIRDSSFYAPFVSAWELESL